jgi:hypothetical protein
MKQFVCAAAFLVAAGVLAADDKEYTSKGGKFSVRFPGKVVEKDIAAAGASGKAVVYEAKSGTYTVTYVDLPEAAAEALKTPEAVEIVLAATRDASVKEMKGKLLEDKKVKLGGVPGMDFKVELPESKIMRNQMYISGTRLYQVMIVGSKDFVGGGESDKFLKSFKIEK